MVELQKANDFEVKLLNVLEDVDRRWQIQYPNPEDWPTSILDASTDYLKGLFKVNME